MIDDLFVASIPTDEHINEYRKRYGLPPYPTKENDPAINFDESKYGLWLITLFRNGSEVGRVFTKEDPKYYHALVSWIEVPDQTYTAYFYQELRRGSSLKLSEERNMNGN